MVKPCIKCGGIDINNDGRCRPCRKIVRTIYYKVNFEKIKIAKAIYLRANSEKIKLYKAKYQKANLEKIRVAKAQHRKDNSEKVRSYRVNYRKDNLEKIKSYEVNYRKDNSEKRKSYAVNWRKANPEKRRSYEQNRRARKKNNGGKISPDLAKKLYEKQKGKCICCKQSLGKDYHLDHIMPLALGGNNEDWNIQLLKTSCNLQKGAKHPVEYMQSRGLLL